MDKLENSLSNISVNFVLKGFTSILIGVYILLGTYLLEEILIGFLTDGNPLNLIASPQIIEILFFTVSSFVWLFSSLAFYYAGRRNAKKNHTQLWNSSTKKNSQKYIISVLLIFIVLGFFTNAGLIDFLTPIFLILYSFLVLLLRGSKHRNNLILIVIPLFLSLICFFIPSYWYNALTILGITHIAYGIVVKA